MKLISEEQHIPQWLRYYTCPVNARDEQLNFASEQKKQDKLLACRGWLTNDTPDSLHVCATEDTYTGACVHTHTHRPYIHACILNLHMYVCMYVRIFHSRFLV